MKSAVHLFILFLLLAPALGQAASLRDRVYDFLHKNVEGRKQKLSVEGTIAAEGDNYLVKFDAQISWGVPQKTEEGIVLLETREIKQSNTKLDKAGNPTKEIFNTDRTVVHKHAVREASGTVVGLTTVESNTLEDSTGKGFITMMELSEDNSQLYWYESQAAFSEGTINGRDIIPVAAAAESTLFLDPSGKLQTNQTLKFYKVDLNKNLERSEVYRFNISASEVK